MYELDMPFYHMSFPYLDKSMIEKIDKQLLKNIPDDDWIKNVFRPDTLNYNIKNDVIEIFGDDELIVKIKVSKTILDKLTNDLDIFADEIIKYICIKQYIDLLKFIK